MDTSQQESTVAEVESLVDRLSTICDEVSDEEIGTIFQNGIIDKLLNSILNPATIGRFDTIGEFFLKNKNRSSLVAAIRNAIQRHYSIKSESRGVIGYVSPFYPQWYEEGVLILEGRAPFEGLFCLYKNGRPSYAVVNRDAKQGENLGPDDFDFIDIDEYDKYLKNNGNLPENLDLPIYELKGLLDTNEANEAQYQEVLSSHPWSLGLQYIKLQRHTNLDDKNIPDFTGMRVGNGGRDIFEIKPPTMRVFLANGDFSAEFNSAWNQAERYLHFAREEKDYLRRKGLDFENPRCFLVCGYNLPDDFRNKIRIKERMNPSIQLLTFNDILAFMENTIHFIKRFPSAS